MKKLHLICNSHLDPVWMWDWEEGAGTALSTFWQAARFCEEYDYVFCHNEVTVYKYVEEYAPELFKEIQQLVKEGKWHIMGGWFLQPDCNIPSGESFMRHTLICQRYFKEKFGVTATPGYNVDSFGHNAGIPKILRAGGMENYVFMRPSKEEQGRNERLFWWESDDGSRVTAFRIRFLMLFWHRIKMPAWIAKPSVQQVL